jgi:hypothetical protein
MALQMQNPRSADHKMHKCLYLNGNFLFTKITVLWEVTSCILGQRYIPTRRQIAKVYSRNIICRET